MISSTSKNWLAAKKRKRNLLLRYLNAHQFSQSGRKIFLVILGIVVSIFLFRYISDYIYRSRAAENDVTVTMENTSSPNTSMQVGEDVVLSIGLRTTSAQKKISAANLAIDFDSNLFDYVSGSLTQTPANYFNDVIRDETQTVGSTQRKRLQLTLTAKKEDELLTNFTQLTVRFKSKTEGSATFQLQKNLSQIVGTDDTQAAIVYAVVPEEVELNLSVQGKQYLREAYITSDGKELWSRECPLLLEPTGNQAEGSPNATLCTNWSRTSLTTLIPNVAGEQIYSSYSGYVFVDKNSKRFVRESIVERSGNKIWFRNCELEASGTVSSCTAWQSKDIAIMQNAAGYDGYVYVDNDVQRLKIAMIDAAGTKAWTADCPVILESNGERNELAGDPDTARCGSWVFASDSLPTSESTAYQAVGLYRFSNVSGSFSYRQSFIQSTGTTLWYRNCVVDGACSEWRSTSLANLRSVGNESYSGYSAYIVTKSMTGGQSCIDDSSCGQNAVCQANQTCSCQPQYFNCDGDWSNGCEQAGSCTRHVVTLRLKLKFQGITQKPPPALNEMRVKVMLKGSRLASTQVGYANLKVTTGNIWEGAVPFQNILVGDGYEVFIKGPKHLQRRFCVLTPTETAETPYTCDSTDQVKITLVEGENVLDFSQVLQLGGDLPFDGANQDGVIDSIDFTYIKNNFTGQDEEAVHSGDLNLDNFVGAQDYSIPVAAFQLEKNADEE